MHGLLDYLNEAGSIDAKGTFVLNNLFARDILKRRDVEAALGTKITLDLQYLVPLPQGGQRGRADHPGRATFRRRAPGQAQHRGLRRGRLVVPATVPQKKGRLFGLGRRA